MIRISAGSSTTRNSRFPWFSSLIPINAVTYWKVWRDHFVPIFSQLITIYHLIIIIIIIIIVIVVAEIEFSLGGSGPYTNTDKTNKNKYT